MKVRTYEGTFDVEKISMEGAKPYTAWEDPTEILKAKAAILDAINLVGEGELAEYLEAILPICDGNVPLEWDLCPMSMAEEIAEEECEGNLASRLYHAAWVLEEELWQASTMLGI